MHVHLHDVHGNDIFILISSCLFVKGSSYEDLFKGFIPLPRLSLKYNYSTCLIPPNPSAIHNLHQPYIYMYTVLYRSVVQGMAPVSVTIIITESLCDL